MVCRLPIPPRLGCRGIDDITAGFALSTVAKFSVTRGKCVLAVVDLTLDVLDKDEPDVYEHFRRW